MPQALHLWTAAIDHVHVIWSCVEQLISEASSGYAMNAAEQVIARSHWNEALLDTLFKMFRLLHSGD